MALAPMTIRSACTSLRDKQNLFNSRPKGDAEFRFAPVFAAWRHELFHAHHADFTLAGHTLFGISRSALDDMQNVRRAPCSCAREKA